MRRVIELVVNRPDVNYPVGKKKKKKKKKKTLNRLPELFKLFPLCPDTHIQSINQAKKHSLTTKCNTKARKDYVYQVPKYFPIIFL